MRRRQAIAEVPSEEVGVQAKALSREGGGFKVPYSGAVRLQDAVPVAGEPRRGVVRECASHGAYG